MKIPKFLIGLMLTAASGLFIVSCGDSKDEPDPGPNAGIKIELTLPSTVELTKDEPCTLSMGAGSVVYTTDIIQLQGSDGKLIDCQITAVNSDSFTFAIPAGTADGSYRVYIKRGSERKQLGTMNLKFLAEKWQLQEGTTVFGTVSTDQGPVANVVISDGVDFAVTNAEGRYELKSKKAYKYVFMSVPSGYEPKTAGILPINYFPLTAAATTPENVDFKLTKVDQSSYRVLFFGDMHLANRNDDLKQFAKFASDVNTNGKKGRTYAITLGDMTWDIYWYDNNFQFAQYLDLMNSSFKNLMVYHTIGNHDNDYKAKNNFDAKNDFILSIAPNYYSFNIGDVHYVVLDNIDCSTYDGTTSRDYKQKVFIPQLQWLAKDLSYVDKSTPVILTMHAPLFYANGATTFKNELENVAELLPILKDYKVHYVTGHTHKSYNVTSAHSVLKDYPDFMEHNQTAVCGDWWWSGKLTPGALTAHDGSPAGYSIWDITGKDFKWIYKGTGLDENIQFRTYDLNNVKFTQDDIPGISGDAVASWQRYCDAYKGAPDNKVLINLWNYDPEWTVTVTTETGQTLEAKPVMAYDPLHIEAMSKKRFQSTKTSAPNFITQNWCHFFEVTAPDADTDLTITVKDRFGRTFTEKMARPKAFNTAAYTW